MCLNETYNKVRIGKNLSDAFPNQNGLQQDTLQPLFFNFSLEYVIKKNQEISAGLRLDGTHQLLVYADDINILDENINGMKKNKEAVLDTSKDTGL
jgi:hypothetical protein